MSKRVLIVHQQNSLQVYWLDLQEIIGQPHWVVQESHLCLCLISLRFEAYSITWRSRKPRSRRLLFSLIWNTLPIILFRHFPVMTLNLWGTVSWSIICNNISVIFYNMSLITSSTRRFHEETKEFLHFSLEN